MRSILQVHKLLHIPVTTKRLLLLSNKYSKRICHDHTWELFKMDVKTRI